MKTMTMISANGGQGRLLPFVAGAAFACLAFASQAAVPPLNTNRVEVLKTFAENVYGVRPDLSGFRKTCSVADRGIDAKLKARRKDVTLNVATPCGATNFTAVALLPERADGRPVPCFVYISFRRPDAMIAKTANRLWQWPVEKILARGYATVSFYYRDVFPDEDAAARAFGADAKRPANGWGAISAWALAASRVMDWLETEKAVDAKKVAIVGLSRLGKTSLWAGATDTRFAYVVINGSGCMGARPSGCNLFPAGTPGVPDYLVGETIKVITGAFPHWFAPNCRKFAGRDADMPFDQHDLVACIAPRLVAVGSAEGDPWACPSGEHAGLALASPAWGTAQGNCHYHIRPGGHDINVLDWEDYMDFAAAHGW